MKRLRIILIHGTWSAGKWTRVDSTFRSRLEYGLRDLGIAPDIEAIPWNGKNRWRARAYVADEVNKKLDQKAGGQDQCECLIIAHSHGGNIATEAVRERMKEKASPPILGVVCLNTPFLTNEVRGSSGYLLVWACLAFALCAGIWLLGLKGLDFPLPRPLKKLMLPVDVEAQRQALLCVLLVLGAIISLLFTLSRRIRKNHQDQRSWEPAPNVLCLSSPDDEAITFLGLGEGVANLPQLLLHPMALSFSTFLALLSMYLAGELGWCGRVIECWDRQLVYVAAIFALWMALAIVGGVIGALAVSILFGVSRRDFFRNLVSRVLVSYVPLRPARCHFRGIHELPVLNPLKFLHSQIFDSSQTVTDICHWLKFYAADPRPHITHPETPPST